jgi:enoyl-CoA hydratase/carnithine racemase
MTGHAESAFAPADWSCNKSTALGFPCVRPSVVPNIPQLEEVVSLIETDESVKVVVFDSAIDKFFLIHYDLLAKPEESANFPLGRTGLQALPDMFVRISRVPVVSIASIRGRVTGVGSELALACDMRFASREKALLSQWEVGAGLVPGGGAPSIASALTPC